MLLISTTFLWTTLVILSTALIALINYIIILNKRNNVLEKKEVSSDVPPVQLSFYDGRREYDSFPDGIMLHITFPGRHHGTILVKTGLSDADYASLEKAMIARYNRENSLHFGDIQRGWTKIAVRARADRQYLADNFGDPTIQGICAEVATFPENIRETLMNQALLAVPIDHRTNLRTEMWRNFFEVPPFVKTKAKTAIIDTNSPEE